MSDAFPWIGYRVGWSYADDFMQREELRLVGYLEGWRHRYTNFTSSSINGGFPSPQIYMKKCEKVKTEISLEVLTPLYPYSQGPPKLKIGEIKNRGLLGISILFIITPKNPQLIFP